MHTLPTAPLKIVQRCNNRSYKIIYSATHNIPPLDLECKCCEGLDLSGILRRIRHYNALVITARAFVTQPTERPAA